MYESTKAKVEQIKLLLLAGATVSQVRAKVKAGPTLVVKVRTQLLMEGARFAPCGCGRRAGHKGMCAYRLANLPYPRRPGGRPKGTARKK